MPVVFSAAHFQQLHSDKCASLKGKVTSVYKHTAKGILMSPPFCYPQRISMEVSEGIVDYGDKLMSNALAESDSDGDLEELNQIGEDMQVGALFQQT